ncbi:hypothetical protein AtubIFM55763_006186 [Aspergillus tubingensis]|uniref:DUF7726 domain-containing protein n=2 Tax=Aspergillus subgen. Circumdati TaxID=2720871 RepID=A0A8H3Y0Z9_ASPTU|nr:SWIRM domain family protein [Aspergillus tubingensis]GAQ39746.1 similar to An07g02290 [Aspergillus niger]GFN18112.1 SWIRM domain family protein [Aspergillus tubingensis]GLA59067.1 hypothetical protein AtubIFM54640_009797 [Aspergillus tubingensis]GLA74932.1 hypothetical protein AtubIFM55763_006186 [Aspergillus tubingensis]GLA89740.1 hypothetical protein AtubIFM56815_004230 [Aspergillus tubingensis]
MPAQKRTSIDMMDPAIATGPDKENQPAAGAASPSGNTQKSCDEIRQEIRDFIASGQMSASEFQRAINVSPRSYSEFLSQEGVKGARSATYKNALKFFDSWSGGPVVPLAETQPAATAAGSAPKRAKKNQPASPAAVDLSGVHLDGDEDGSVQVFETCDVVRRKIRAHLRKTGVTQAGFMREAAKAAYPQGTKRLNANSFGEFLKKKGPTAGSSGTVFYASYVYFEKLRIKNGESKDAFRLEMEKLWPNGFELENVANGRMWCGPNVRPWVDIYGKVHFS